ncbi:hypothetical protein [Niabella sp.]|uniref:hypothetical protein n=1 Tax=Niabella sp. TaxID=1962976 RepID=UPI00262B9386|nr:hypothetical protein [Niabella sp.]
MLKRMPFVLLPVTAILLFIAGLFTSNNEWINVHLPDTVFMMPRGHMMGFSAFFLFLLWLINIATYNILFSDKLIWFHILATLAILSFVLLYTNIYPGELSGDPPRRYIEGGEERASGSQDVNTILLCSSIVFVLVQLVFIANVLIGLYRKTISGASAPL